jgi:uncharacterized protein (DUF433 family)
MDWYRSVCFDNTRISVFHIGKMAARGVSVREILEDYPLTRKDVKFARRYYLDVLEEKRL